MNTVTATYNSSVKVQAGWRSIKITALLEKVSEKRAKVVKVIDVDGDGDHGYTSRTGAKRQQYSINYVAQRELDSIKILSKCLSIN